ncbi:MAG: MFS transporter [Alphaproteobacteria bacterium]|nr:MFS transporter [Alphaproteobacteria bacterium]
MLNPEPISDTEAGVVAASGVGSLAYRWYVVSLLLAVYILAYFDRFILSLVIDPIKHAMGLSDFEIGLLLGPAFSLFNMVVVIPLGWQADRSSRKWLMVLAVLCWCTMTSGVAFIASFLPLLFLRLGLGLGEAIALPCSVSIISDYFHRAHRARPISVYMAGTYLGAGLAFLIGGNLVGWLEKLGPFHILGLGPFQPWQGAFLLVGLPGFVFVALMLTIREPVRTETLHVTAKGVPLKTSLDYIRRNWKAFGVLIIGASCNIALSIMVLWNVPLFQRSWHWSVAEVGTLTGIYFLTAGPLGTFLAVWLSRKLSSRTIQDGAARVLILGVLISIPAYAAYPIAPTGEISAAIMFVAIIGTTLATAGGPSAIALITPGEMRSQVFALYTAVVTLLGPLFAPPLIGWLVDLSGSPNALGVVLSGFAVAAGLPSLFFMLRWFKDYQRSSTTMEALARAERGHGV